MGFLWGIVKTVALIFAAVVVILLVVDALLLRNLFRKDET